MENYKEWSSENSERVKEEGMAAAEKIFAKPSNKQERKAIVLHLEKHGLAIVRVLEDGEECLEHMVDVVKRLWLTQPWKETLVVRDPKTGAPIDIDEQPKKYMRLFMNPPTKEALEHYRAVAPFHCIGFGAAADPSSFHSPLMEKVRTDKALYKLARQYLGRKELWNDMNRTITKLPGAGDEELIHWDKPIMFLKESERHEEKLCAKLLFNRQGASFVYVPGTHTPEFRKEFTRRYKKLYAGAKETDAKFGLEMKKEDPMDIFGKKIVAHVPAGCAVFWCAAAFFCILPWRV